MMSITSFVASFLHIYCTQRATAWIKASNESASGVVKPIVIITEICFAENHCIKTLDMLSDCGRASLASKVCCITLTREEVLHFSASF